SRSLYAYGHTPGPHAFPTRRSSDLVTSDVPIYDPTISRRHAEVSLTDGGVKVKDAGSSNGTFLNGARITEAIAVENDVITFGKVAFRVKEVSAPAARPQVVPSVSEIGRAHV